MNPMMMMMLPQLMKGSSSEQQDPMHGMMMMTLMKKMQSSSSDDYSDYDYDYVYGYDYSYSAPTSGASAMSSSDDYDYDYVYDDSSSASPSPLSGIIQQMLQAKMAAIQAPVKVTVDSSESDESTSNQLPSPVVASATPVVVAKPVNVEIAPPRASPRQPKEPRPSDQVSYRSAP